MRIPAIGRVQMKVAGASRSKRNPAELLVLGNPRKRSKRANPAELLLLGNPKTRARASANPASSAGSAELLSARASRFERVGNSTSRDNAVKTYREFHQAEPGAFGEPAVLEYDETQSMPKHTAVLGDLIALGLDDRVDGHALSPDELVDEWKRCSRISLEGRDVKLSADPSGGNQLYFVGAGQSISESDLADLGAVSRGDELLIGPVFFIVYNARKVADGGTFDGYVHKFAENGGRRPSLYYDPQIERLILRGGSYHVEGVGIVN